MLTVNDICACIQEINAFLLHLLSYTMTEKSWMQRPKKIITPDTYIRNLPYSVCKELADELDPPGTATNWKDFVVKIPKGPNNFEPKFTVLNIK